MTAFRRVLCLPLVSLFALPSLLPAIELTGTLVDADDTPLAGLTVQVEHLRGRSDPEGDRFVRRTDTAADGTFRLELPPADRDYSLLVYDPDGHLLYGGTHIDEDRDLGALRVEQTGSLSGRVLTEDNTPVADVDVVAEYRLRLCRCRHYVEARRTRTGPDGAFAFENLPPNEYRCAVRSPDYEPSYNTIESVEDFAYLELRVKPGCTIRGTVRDPDGKPVPDIQVRTRTGRHTRTDEQGGFALHGLAEGTRHLDVRGTRYARPMSRSWEVESTPGAPAEMVLEVVPVGALEVTLTAAADDASFPESLAAHFRSREGHRYGYVNRTAAVSNRTAVFRGLAPGAYTVSLRGKDWPSVEADVSVESHETAALALELPVTHTVTGLVLGPDDAPRKDVTVRASREEQDEEDTAEPAVRIGAETSARTDKEGRFALRQLTPGKYEVRIDDDDLIPFRETMQVPRSEQAEDLVYRLQAGLAISGTIQEADGSPARDTDVTVQGPIGDSDHARSVWRRAELEPDGTFRVAGLPQGDYRVHVSDDANTVDLSLDAVKAGTDDLFVSLGRRVTATISVVDPDGRPLAGAAVSHTREEEGESRRFFSHSSSDSDDDRTDRGGEFTLTLRAGNLYRVSVAHPDFLDTSEKLDLRQAETDTETLRITLGRGATVKGTVIRAADRTPASGLAVRFSSGENSMPFNMGGAADEQGVRTDDQGAFTLHGVPVGVVKLLVSTTDEEPTMLGDALVQTREDEVAETTIELPEFGAVKGHWNPKAGPCPGRLQVMLYTTGTRSQPRSVRSEADGTFEFRKVPPGRYMLMWFDMSRARSGRVSTRPEPRTIEVKANEDTVVQVGKPEEPEGPQLTGRVTRDGRPVGPGSLTLFQPSAETEPSPFGMSASAGRTDIAEDGTFSLSRPQPGEYWYAVQLKSGDETPVPGVSFTGKVPLDEKTGTLDLQVAGVELKGTVTGPDGNPLDESWIRAIPTDVPDSHRNYLMRWTRTSEDGTFTLDGLTPGTYDVHVQHTSGNAVRKGVMVADGAVTLQLSVEKGIPLTGTVKNETGGSVAGAFVAAVNSESEEMGGYGRLEDDGSFAIEPPPAAGTYHVAALREGYAIDIRRVALQEPVTCDLTLVPGGSLRIQVRDADGQPAPGKEVHVLDADGNEVFRFRNPMWAQAPAPWSAFAIAPTDDQGETTVGALPEGPYTLRIDGHDTETTARVTALETTTARMEL